MSETKSIIEGVEILDKRRSGNSTRQINAAIDYLFLGYKIKIIDHAINSQGKQSLDVSENLMGRIKKRLKFEHGLSDKDFVYNENDVTMWLIFNKL